MVKNNFILLLFLFAAFWGCNSENSSPQETENIVPSDTASSRFSFVLYDGLTKEIIPPVLSKLEDNYSRVINSLAPGQNIQVFTVKIWNDNEHFLDDMQKSLGVKYPGAAGYVYGRTEIRLLKRGDITQAALHEFCHCVSFYVNSTIGNNPRWLWEAIAIYEAGEFVNPKSLSYLVQGNFPTLLQLSVDVNQGSQIIYQLGYIIVDYIKSTWGGAKYIELIKTNGNIASTLGISTTQFEAGWKKFVQDKYLK